MFESIFSAAGNTGSDAILSVSSLLLALLTAFAAGAMISLVYLKTGKSDRPSQGFALTLFILPAILSIIIMLVGSNIARAFSLAGAFSIIRFRSAPGDPKDIAQVLLALAVGLACGMGYLLIAILFSVIFCIILLLLNVIHFGQIKVTGKLLKITIPENLNYEDIFDEILDRYTESHHLEKVKTTDLGSLFELTWLITVRPGVSEKEFIDTLRCHNGNLNISLYAAGPVLEA
ncbi:MAG: DUF4956 domain-containing protein [Bacillota bacterium]|nr:DUF4956 domain-containing protein [Bacillota bacterium]